MIKRIFIDNYKCFVNTEISFTGRASFLFGRNGSGKTAFFDALGLLRDFVSRGVPLASGLHPDGIALLGGTYTRWKAEADSGFRSQRFELDVEDGEGGVYNYRLAVDNRGGGGYPRVDREEVLYGGRPVYRYEDATVHLFDNRSFEEKVAFSADWSRSFIASAADRPENGRLVWLRNWFGNIVVLRPNPWRVNGVAAGEARFLERDFSNFAAWFRGLRQETSDQAYEAFPDEIRHAVPGLQGLRLRRTGGNARELVVQFRGRAGGGGGQEYLLEELSEGQRLLIALYAAVYYAIRENGVFCVDEPDNFLALPEITPLIETLTEEGADVPRGQVFISSHHPKFYDSAAEGQGLWFSRDGEGDGGGFSTRVRPFRQVFGGFPGLPRSEIAARGWEG